LPAEERIAIGDEPIRVELLPGIGGRLHRLRAFGHDLLRTPDDPAQHRRDPFLWGAYVMAPWCNRTAAVPTRVGAQLVDLSSNFPDGSAIHGQVYATPWQVKADGTLSVRGGGDGWPWPYESSMRVDVNASLLRIDLALTNRAQTPMPGGIGLHPWFRGALEVRFSADRVVPSNTDPACGLQPVSGAFDLRERRTMPAGLDAGWLASGGAAFEMRWPRLGIRATAQTVSDAPVWIVAASPPDLEAVAIEPQTHAAFGLRRFLAGEPGGLQPMAPGATLRLRIELAFESS
jgi:aldose 1-epimerase